MEEMIRNLGLIALEVFCFILLYQYVKFLAEMLKTSRQPARIIASCACWVAAVVLATIDPESRGMVLAIGFLMGVAFLWTVQIFLIEESQDDWFNRE